MEEEMTNFIISCVSLGKELINKDKLTEKEEGFLENLALITDKYFN